MEIPCRLCTAFESDNDTLKEKLITYISQLKEEEKSDEMLYALRIERCEVCNALRQGICGYCGCFVIVRAAKKQMACPHPKGSLW